MSNELNDSRARRCWFQPFKLFKWFNYCSRRLSELVGRVDIPGRLGGAMIHTRICELLGITYPIVLGGMGTATSAPLVAAVSNSGGLGTLGTSSFRPAQLESEVSATPERAEKPCRGKHLRLPTDDPM